MPGVFRAATRTNSRALRSASVAIPSHRAAQVMCDTGSIVRDEMSEYGVGRICSTLPLERNMKPIEQVPRMPKVSHSPYGSSSRFGRCT